MTIVFLIIAIVLEFIVALAWGVPFALPRPEAWQAFALVLFFASFLPLGGTWPWSRP